MPQQVFEVKSEYNINLAFMECFTSCVMTYLNIKGKNYRKLLLDYWNISYQFKTLLSGKDARQLPLEYLYGVKMTFVKDDVDSLKRHMLNGNKAICLCTASKLAFFPPSFLGMEAGGFRHSILFWGWDERMEHYLVMDPVVNVSTSMKMNEVATASAIGQGSREIHYFLLEEPSSPFVMPDLESILIYCTDRNLTLYRNHKKNRSEPIISENSSNEEKARAWQHWFSNRNSGIHALEQFEKDLSRSSEWSVRQRNDWILMNIKTITSIRQIRSLVWTAYRDITTFSDMQLEEGQRQIKAILTVWNTLNYLLLKYKIGLDSSVTIPAILMRIQELKRVELHFLEWLHQTVRECV